MLLLLSSSRLMLRAERRWTPVGKSSHRSTSLSLVLKEVADQSGVSLGSGVDVAFWLGFLVAKAKAEVFASCVVFKAQPSFQLLPSWRGLLSFSLVAAKECSNFPIQKSQTVSALTCLSALSCLCASRLILSDRNSSVCPSVDIEMETLLVPPEEERERKTD